jgi:hypothetical protein
MNEIFAENWYGVRGKIIKNKRRELLAKLSSKNRRRVQLGLDVPSRLQPPLTVDPFVIQILNKSDFINYFDNCLVLNVDDGVLPALTDVVLDATLKLIQFNRNEVHKIIFVGEKSGKELSVEFLKFTFGEMLSSISEAVEFGALIKSALDLGEMPLLDLSRLKKIEGKYCYALLRGAELAHGVEAIRAINCIFDHADDDGGDDRWSIWHAAMLKSFN